MKESQEHNFMGIGYDWLLVPQDIKGIEYDVILSVAIFHLNKTQVFTYHASLPPKYAHIEQSDVSGTLGLLWPVADKVNNVKAAALERLISDSIQWILSDQDLSVKNTIILLQGPLLPKLRGRFLYSGISKNVSIQSITYQTEWLKRLENIEKISEFLKSKQKDEIVVSSVFPSLNVDQSTRSWIAILAKTQQMYHFETITNMWDYCRDNKIIDERKEEIEMLLKNLYNEDEKLDIPLPKPLAEAVLAAKKSIEFEKDVIVFQRYFNRCKGEPFTEESLKGLRDVFPNIFQTTNGKVNFEYFYGIFKNKYESGEFKAALEYLKSDKFTSIS